MTKAAEVAMAPIPKAFPTFSGALIVADALGNMASSQSLSTSFILAFLSCLMEGCGQAGFHLNLLGGSGGGGWRKSIQLNNLESVSTILIFTSIQKINDSMVQLKVQQLVKG